jgi:hypothetical protein
MRASRIRAAGALTTAAIQALVFSEEKIIVVVLYAVGWLLVFGFWFLVSAFNSSLHLLHSTSAYLTEVP